MGLKGERLKKLRSEGIMGILLKQNGPEILPETEAGYQFSSEIIRERARKKENSLAAYWKHVSGQSTSKIHPHALRQLIYTMVESILLSLQSGRGWVRRFQLFRSDLRSWPVKHSSPYRGLPFLQSIPSAELFN
ncbi:hypothetical protein L484_024108 [Morus notabilis]|uniref:Uncharacterized protein n=1 Tax=Morus notabilis TaxID=981085 RepID=W9RQ32_9ROSA|nr:hypothetical protein L484_024108 [Morus notabilis]